MGDWVVVMAMRLWVSSTKLPIARALFEACRRAAFLPPRELRQSATILEIIELARTAQMGTIQVIASGLEGPEEIVWALVCGTARRRECRRSWVAKLITSPRGACGLLEMWFRYCAARRAGKSRPIPNSIKRGLADAIGCMSPEDISAGALIRGRVRFRDVVALVHPRMHTAQGARAIGALMGGGRQ